MVGEEPKPVSLDFFVPPRPPAPKLGAPPDCFAGAPPEDSISKYIVSY